MGITTCGEVIAEGCVVQTLIPGGIGDAREIPRSA
jgi:hypothetical protein